MDVSLRFEIEDFYAEYAACLNQARYDAWPEFFVDDCKYVVQARENFERGLPLATISLESKGMLKDRIYGVTQTLYFGPYYQRHLITGIIPREVDDEVSVEANYLVIRTQRNELPTVYSCGRYFDRIVRTAEGLRFREKICIFDSEIIANSLIYPL